jgi:signal transduction histidine kinase
MERATRRVLVIEDDDDFAQSLANVLAARGYELRVVSEPAAVAGALSTFPAQVALVDLRLGQSSGLDLIAELKRTRPALITVIMTAYVAADSAIEALRRGAYDYMTKPFSATELLVTLDRCFERLELERARGEAEDQLRQAQRLEAIGQLTGGVAHDFNNLLAVVVGNLDLLKRQLTTDEDQMEMVDSALQAAERGATLIKRLLAFSRRQQLAPGPVDVNALVTNMSHLLRRSLGESIRLEPRLAEGLWTCSVDAGQLETALLNLVLNARDAMPDGGRLEIVTRNTYLRGDREVAEGEGEPHVCMAVADGGTGIPEEIRGRVFEPFFTTKGPGHGTGLGLSMVFGFVKQSNGHVRLTSEVGAGTTFALYFARSEQGAPAAVAAAADEAPLARGERILLCEDNDDVRALAHRILGDLGYQVVEAESGAAALALVARGFRPDLLLTDLVLPHGPNGYQLGVQVQALLPGCKLLFTSGYAEGRTAEGQPERAQAPLLAKPFRRADLARQVRRALDGP